METEIFVKVFITKKGDQFRAQITERYKSKMTGSYPLSPTKYEVIINGKEWNKGKGQEHINKIRPQVKRLIEQLNVEANLILEGENS